MSTYAGKSQLAKLAARVSADVGGEIVPLTNEKNLSRGGGDLSNAIRDRRANLAYCILHGPAPPHRGHEGVSPAELFPVADPTAKTLSERAVFVDPQAGHETFSLEFIVRAKCSNDFSHAL
ncbi:MAG TPA: hypothetical protein VG722_07625, partial [Tepidisphaeraceae bacterium]|nr:hypothetical protein [Tepidisphaeraceae bacterium]